MILFLLLLLQLPSSAAPPTPRRLDWNKEVCMEVLPGESRTATWAAVATPQTFAQYFTNNKIATWNLTNYQLHVTITPPICLPIGDCIPLDPPLPMKEFWPETQDVKTEMVWVIHEGGKFCYSVRALGTFYYVY